MMVYRFVTLIAISFLLSSCVTRTPPSPRVETFKDEDYLSFLEQGTSTIVGEAFLTTRGGGIRLGAGRTVQLIPVTSYTTEFMQRQSIGHERLTPPIDKRLDRYTRLATADSRGEFRFERVPAGSYYLMSTITWEVPRVGRYDVYYEETGGTALGHVTVGPGEQKRVVVTQ